MLKSILFTSMLVASAFFLTKEATGQSKYFGSIEEIKTMTKELSQLLISDPESFVTNTLDLQVGTVKLDQQTEVKTKMIQYLDELKRRFGEINEIRKFKEQELEDVFFREKFLVMLDRSAILIYYTFYKNKNGWLLNGFHLDDNFNNIVDGK